MPSRDWKFRIKDILDAVEVVTDYVSGMTFEDFVRDQRTIDAVVRRLTIIGEASAHMPEHICRQNPDIPWIDMRAMRNFVVHEYFGVSEDILWDTIHNDLPGIVEPLQRLLTQGSD
ncbi:MAG: DUF86 domain-containing protein [Deltaproteobacteria bacterium]|nr:DUF86 domain-containing protein [Deltaproteobacteria bacterium]